MSDINDIRLGTVAPSNLMFNAPTVPENPDGSTGDVDVTSVECWDTYVGSTKVYHKDKTLDNCWKKYDLVFPYDWIIVSSQLTLVSNSADYIEWITPTRFIVKSIPMNDTLYIRGKINSDQNVDSVYINSKSFKIKLNKVVSGVTTKIDRSFTGLYKDSDRTQPLGYTVKALSTEYINVDGYTGIAYVSKTVPLYRWLDFEFSIYSKSAAIEDLNLVVDIEPIFDDNTPISLNPTWWSQYNVKVPIISDLVANIDKIAFNCNPRNNALWNVIKSYYATHVLEGIAVDRKFQSAVDIGPLEITLPNNRYLVYDGTFIHSEITSLTITAQKYSVINVLRNIFNSCFNLTTLTLNVPSDRNLTFFADAKDISAAFEGCALTTYPSDFICWNSERDNVDVASRLSTLCDYAFNECELNIIPSFNSNDRLADDNTIKCATVENMFNYASNLTVIGPVIDLALIKPDNANNIFAGCTKLIDARIKNLNHGDWHLDGSAYSGHDIHGNLSALNAASIQYLFENLKDLANEFNPLQDVATIYNSFTLWEHNGESRSTWSLNSAGVLSAIARYEDITDAPLMIHTKEDVTIAITVEGLVDGDSLLFLAENQTPILTITENGEYDITNSGGVDRGFALVGDVANMDYVHIKIDTPWDLSVPSVISANLYCPSAWETNITDAMVTAANAKGWAIYIGGTLKTV